MQITPSLAIKVPRAIPATSSELSTTQLNAENENEVLSFLSERPLHTVAMVGFILDNGLVSPLNRGTFFGCRNRRGKLEGVGLIGHATLLETRTDRALEALAAEAGKCKTTHMIMGEKERIRDFWSYYSEDDSDKRLLCRELLFELRWPVPAQEMPTELRPATIADLPLIVPVQAELAMEESGDDPLDKDPKGFYQRCERRVHQGRTWVLVRNNKLIFKAEVVSKTPGIVYLEGVWVAADQRGKKYGLTCVSAVCQALLRNAKAVCLLVNEKNAAAQALYRRAGFKLRGTYETIFLNNNSVKPCLTLVQ